MLEPIIQEIRFNITTIQQNMPLYTQNNFSDRAAALDFLEFHVIDRIEGLLLRDVGSVELIDLKQAAEMVHMKLERVNADLFRRLRQNIASGQYTSAALQQQLITYAGGVLQIADAAEQGYATLDILVNGLLLSDAAPEDTRQRDPEMVFYQPTPVRIVLEMIKRTTMQQPDVFYDIGSGLGQVAILVHLLRGVRAIGVEIEPAYCAYARRCVQGLNLTQVQFSNADAREADYSDGTIFFLYTPFEGSILNHVLERLRQESTHRSIRICSYGPCTQQVAQQQWLECLDQNDIHSNRLAIFKPVKSGD